MIITRKPSRALSTSILAALLFASLPLDSNAQTNAANSVVRSCCRVETAAAPLSDRSVYQLNSTWTNDANQAVQLSQLRGKPQVVAMIFTSCQGACPLLVEQMRQAAGELRGADTNFGYVLVTFDPERDSQEVPQYLIAVVEDITEKIQVEHVLRERERQLLLAQSAAQLGDRKRPSEFAGVRPLRRSRDHPGNRVERPWPRHQEENGRHR